MKKIKICPPSRLAECDGLHVRFINALAQFWRTTRSFHCIGKPKEHHLLLYLDGCKITYTDKEGRTYIAESGDVVYTPLGSEYRAVLSDFCDEQSHTVGINLALWDEGEPIALSDGICILHAQEHGGVARLFARALTLEGQSPLAGQILMLEILEALCRPAAPTVPAVLTPALGRLTDVGSPAPTVAELAALCHISEPYLRRLFRQALGTSPAAYRKRLCLAQACRYLTYGDISVGEISSLLGYASVSHFIKEFGRAYGVSPLKYRKTSAKNG